MTTAVLAVQGAFAEHERSLGSLGEPVVELRRSADLSRPFDRLVLPGGESTAQAKLLREQGMLEPLRALIRDGMPVLATCAGLILLADDLAEVDDEPGAGPASGTDPSNAAAGPRREQRLATFPMRAHRNAYGRQLGSFRAEALMGSCRIPATFIRAPRIERLGAGAQPLVLLDGAPVAARYGNQIACAFHPELDENTAVHELFCSLG